MNILNPRFKYTKSVDTKIESTWKKFGFKPTTEAERQARQRRFDEEPPPANVRPLRREKGK